MTQNRRVTFPILNLKRSGSCSPFPHCADANRVYFILASTGLENDRGNLRSAAWGVAGNDIIKHCTVHITVISRRGRVIGRIFCRLTVWVRSPIKEDILRIKFFRLTYSNKAKTSILISLKDTNVLIRETPLILSIYLYTRW